MCASHEDNEWTIVITSQTITESAGVTVTQSSGGTAVTGTEAKETFYEEISTGLTQWIKPSKKHHRITSTDMPPDWEKIRSDEHDTNYYVQTIKSGRRTWW